jgi:hypothetical protein
LYLSTLERIQVRWTREKRRYESKISSRQDQLVEYKKAAEDAKSELQVVREALRKREEQFQILEGTVSGLYFENKAMQETLDTIREKGDFEGIKNADLFNNFNFFIIFI